MSGSLAESPSAVGRTCRESDMFGPIRDRGKQRDQVAAFGREQVSGPVLMIYQVGDPEVTQPVGQDTGRHLRNPRRQVPVCGITLTQLPHDSKRPPPTEHVEKGEGVICSSGIRAAAALWRHVASQRMVLLAAVATTRFSHRVKCLDFRCNKRDTKRASESDAKRPSAW
jgi:hypothetical protein